MTQYEGADEYCPHCDNHYVIEAKTPQLMLEVEGEDGRVDPRCVCADSIIRDPRVRETQKSAQDGATIDHGGPLAAAHEFHARLAQGGAGAAPGGAAGAHMAPPPGYDDDELDWS